MIVSENDTAPCLVTGWAALNNSAAGLNFVTVTSTYFFPTTRRASLLKEASLTCHIGTPRDFTSKLYTDHLRWFTSNWLLFPFLISHSWLLTLFSLLKLNHSLLSLIWLDLHYQSWVLWSGSIRNYFGMRQYFGEFSLGIVVLILRVLYRFNWELSGLLHLKRFALVLLVFFPIGHLKKNRLSVRCLSDYFHRHPPALQASGSRTALLLQSVAAKIADEGVFVLNFTATQARIALLYLHFNYLLLWL